MSKETEKVFRAFDEYMNENGPPESPEELEEMLHVFRGEYDSNTANRQAVTADTAETSDDFLELAEYADSQEEALKYAKKSLKLDPDNLDAETLIAALSAKDPFDLIRKYESAIKHGNEVMKKQGYFDLDYTGRFWHIHQTRPYMRLRLAYIDALIRACMFDAAIPEAEELLELNDGDNTGIRYTLMSLYAMKGDEDSALDLYEEYEEDSTMMLLPLSLLHYRKNDLKNAYGYLKKISKHNPDFRKFLKRAVDQGEDLFPENFDPTTYRPDTMDELLVAVFEYDWLYTSVGLFFPWAYEEFAKSRMKKK